MCVRLFSESGGVSKKMLLRNWTSRPLSHHLLTFIRAISCVCAQTCGLCAGAVCEDNPSSDVECTAWKELGYCLPLSEYYTYLRENCPKVRTIDHRCQGLLSARV